MSVRVMTAVWAVNLPAGEKLVLLALADCANDEGKCYPGLTSLAKKTGKSRRSLIDTIHALEKAGHITRDVLLGKGTNYTVHPQEQKQLDLPVSGAKSAPVQEPHQCKKARSTGAKSAPKPSLRTVISSEAKASSLWHALPPDWVPTRALSPNTRMMVENWPPGAFQAELESFRAWAANAKPEKGKGLKKDWDDAFGNWIRTAHRDRYSRVVGLQRNDPNPLGSAFQRIVANC